MASGGKRPNAGRKLGSTGSKVLPEIKQIILDGIKPYLQDIPKLLENLDDKERIDAILELLPYVCSKFAPTQYDDSGNSTPSEQQFTISVKPIDYREAAEPLASEDDN